MSNKIAVYDPTGVIEKEIEKPRLFYFPIRKDIITRVSVSQYSHKIQPKGRYSRAGRNKSAEFFGVGLGLARVPRIKQGALRGTASIVAMARGGRKPHITTPEKKIYKKINRKELKLALASAVSATGNRDLVRERGHIIDNVSSLPMVVSSEVEEVSRTRELWEILEKLGFTDDIYRVKENIKMVGGKASWRGRRRKIRKGPLIVYGENHGILLAARNIIGVDVISASNISVIHLAPGGVPGRLTLWTEDALEKMENRLYDVLERYIVI